MEDDKWFWDWGIGGWIQRKARIREMKELGVRGYDIRAVIKEMRFWSRIWLKMLFFCFEIQAL